MLDFWSTHICGSYSGRRITAQASLLYPSYNVTVLNLSMLAIYTWFAGYQLPNLEF